MLFSKKFWLLAVVVCAALQFLTVRSRRILPVQPDLTVVTNGSFQPDGWYPGEPFTQGAALRAWGSWSGSDDNTGTITLGPFPAPQILRFVAGGYPDKAGNSIHVELVGTGRRRPVTAVAIGEKWQVLATELPESWVGRPIRIIGADAAGGLGGWFAISEPIRGGRGEGNHAFVESFAAWAINGVLLGLMFVAAVRLLIARSALPAPWIALAAAAIVATFGYVAFWLYFAHALAGVVFSWLALGTSALVAFSPRRKAAAPHRDSTPEPEGDSLAEVAAVVKLLFAIGSFYLALLHLFPTGHDFYTVAANRFREALPSDNLLPHILAERLATNQPVRNIGEEWLSSDRPPLQSGWQLLTWPVTKTLGLDRRTASGTSALWFQLLWVAAMYGLLRTLRVPPPRAVAWTATCALAGFFAQNTLYTWPKLSAGAFCCGAFALIVLAGRPGPISRAHAAWAGLFAGLAWLSHGGVAFSFLALLPWALTRLRSASSNLIGYPRREERGGRWRVLGGAVAVFAGLVLPWLAYQKLYDPPANRLLKWHLAGQAGIDSRGTWETIRDAYRNAGWEKAWSNKVLNFHGQIFGDWRDLVDVSADTKTDRRNHEFFHTGRALTWWPLLAAVAWLASHRPRMTLLRDLIPIVGWTILTIVIWCLLMFEPYSAAIHQGSYAVMIALFVLFSVVLDRGGRRWLAIIIPLQAVTFATTWAVGNAAINGPPVGLPVVLVTGTALLWFAIRPCFNREVAAEEVQLRSAPETPASSPRLPLAWQRWWQQPRITLWLLVAIAALMFLRKPHTLHTPQFWAEDGSVFMNDQDQHGAAAFLSPYMGYLHVLPRTVAWLASSLDPRWWPAFYNGVAFVIWLAVLARFFTARFDLPGKPWLALSFLFVPHTGEVLFNVTNLQWLTGFVLIQQVLISPPVTRAQRVTDRIIVAVVSLTGPFVVAFLPLFAWRWWRHRDRENSIAFALTLACAVVQATYVLRVAPKMPFQSLPFEFWSMVEVVVRRLIIWPVFGRDLATQTPGPFVAAGGVIFFAGIFAWILRPHPRRLLRIQIFLALVLILLAGLYRARPDTWNVDNLDFADRYFYIPRVLLAWLLIWEFDAVPSMARYVARIACAAIALFQLRDYSVPAPIDYHWAQHVQPIRDGRPAKIPILPESWILEYRGRPAPR